MSLHTRGRRRQEGCHLAFVADPSPGEEQRRRNLNLSRVACISLASGLVSLFALLAPAVTSVAIGLSAVSLGPCRRVSQARERLAAHGLELGM